MKDRVECAQMVKKAEEEADEGLLGVFFIADGQLFIQVGSFDFSNVLGE